MVGAPGASSALAEHLPETLSVPPVQHKCEFWPPSYKACTVESMVARRGIGERGDEREDREIRCGRKEKREGQAHPPTAPHAGARHTNSLPVYSDLRQNDGGLRVGPLVAPQVAGGITQPSGIQVN